MGDENWHRALVFLVLVVLSNCRSSFKRLVMVTILFSPEQPPKQDHQSDRPHCDRGLAQPGAE
jgi:hypothetical protein